MQEGRQRATSILRKTCCYKEKWKDIWKQNQLGEKVIKAILLIQWILILTYDIIFYTKRINHDQPQEEYYLIYFQ